MSQVYFIGRDSSWFLPFWDCFFLLLGFTPTFSVTLFNIHLAGAEGWPVVLMYTWKEPPTSPLVDTTNQVPSPNKLVYYSKKKHTYTAGRSGSDWGGSQPDPHPKEGSGLVTLNFTGMLTKHFVILHSPQLYIGKKNPPPP